SVLQVKPSEREAEAAAQQEVAETVEAANTAAAAVDFSSLFEETADQRELKLVLKADTQGSLEAVVDSVNAIESPEGDRPRFLLTGTGPVSESDAMLAATSKALLLAYRVKIDPAAQQAIQQEKVMTQSYDIIYKLLEDLEDVLAGG